MPDPQPVEITERTCCGGVFLKGDDKSPGGFVTAGIDDNEVADGHVEPADFEAAGEHPANDADPHRSGGI